MSADLPTKSMESLGDRSTEIDQRLEDFCRKRRMEGIGCSGGAAERKSAGCGGGGGDERNGGEAWREGWISVIGRRRAMEDAVALEEFGSYKFFAVYDGHGGSAVANKCRERLHRLVEEEVAGRMCDLVEWERTMSECFRKMDREVNGRRDDGDEDEDYDDVDVDVDVNTMGSTAVVAIVGKSLVVVANCGDSRAVLCRDGTAVPLSRDHKPDRPDEKERVEAAGGKVLDWNGCRVLGVLSTSRSIGDQYLKPYVISDPEVTVWERTAADKFLVLASDGLWDVMSNELACEVVKRCFEGKVTKKFAGGMSGSTTAEASALLAELAMSRGSKDNISVVVVDLTK